MGAFLIADDSTEKIVFLQSMLNRSGFEEDVLLAMTTEEACRLIELHPEISGAFIDYYIPSKCGPTVIRTLRQKCPHAHIALVSSGDSERNTLEAKAAGADTAICTSMRSDELEKLILGLLEEWKV